MRLGSVFHFTALVACSTHSSHQVKSAREMPTLSPSVDYVHVSPEKLEDDNLDGKRVVVTALVASPNNRFYAGHLFWEDLPIVHLTRGALDVGYELVTIWGSYKKAVITPQGLFSTRKPPEIAVDRYERVMRPTHAAVSSGLLVRDDPEHVVLRAGSSGCRAARRARPTAPCASKAGSSESAALTAT